MCLPIITQWPISGNSDYLDMLVAQIATRIANIEHSSKVNQNVIVYKLRSEDSRDLFTVAPRDSLFSICRYIHIWGEASKRLSGENNVVVHCAALGI
ncbi:MAG TPA: hypothetical protein VFS97_02070 [Nitrososphaeraceae archaeon]|nr:hypothetical protein [Nitrososphaeraceae archaeon]